MAELDLQRKKYAEQLLNNPLFHEIFDVVGKGLDSKLLNCKSREESWDVTKTKQILAALQREVHKAVEKGNAEEIRMEKIQANKEKVRVFRR